VIGSRAFAVSAASLGAAMFIACSSTTVRQSSEGMPDLAQAELAFARIAADTDMRSAFLQFLASDATVFEPGPVNAHDFWQKQEPDPALLAWYPTFAFVSASADLGYDFGPFTYGKRGAEPEAFGQFLSVWRREAGGPWRVVVDAGTGHAKPVLVAPRLESVNARRATRADRPPGESVVLAEEKLAALSERDGYESAIRAVLRADGWRFRPGHEPLAPDAAALPAAEQRGAARLSVIGSATSRAQDLAYAYGELTEISTAKRYAFLHIWRATDGGWRLAVDRLSRIP
jgi:hypothetical protein